MQTTKLSLSILALGAASSFGAIVWTVGDSTTAGRQAPEIWSHNGSSGTTTFVQEGGAIQTNSLPGNQFSPATDQQGDDDFYFAGNYTNQVDGGAAYTPHGIVAATEAGIERAITNSDSTNRIHFNFQGSALPTDVFTVSFAMLDLDNGTNGGQYDFALTVNGIALGNFSHTEATIGNAFTSDPFTLADVNGTAGAPDDNYVQLTASNPGTAARWSNFDYIQMDRTAAIPEPSSTGLALLSIAGLGFIRRRK